MTIPKLITLRFLPPVLHNGCTDAMSRVQQLYSDLPDHPLDCSNEFQPDFGQPCDYCEHACALMADIDHSPIGQLAEHQALTQRLDWQRDALGPDGTHSSIDITPDDYDEYMAGRAENFGYDLTDEIPY